MKKLTMIVALVLLSYHAHAQNQLYTIDPVATARAPWEMGQKTIEGDECYSFDSEEACYTQFLGMTREGGGLFQDFYASGEKATDPYVLAPVEASQYPQSIRHRNVQGALVYWYKNGQKKVEAFIQNGELQGAIVAWHENGQKWHEGHYQKGKPSGFWRYWDEEGNIVQEYEL